MADREFPGTLLVAVDFAPASLRALDVALAWRRDESDVVALHVIDTDLAERMQATGVCSRAEATQRMREHAEAAFARLRSAGAADAFDAMVVEGVPFLEIPKIAVDLACDLIVMGAHGDAPRLRDLVFGSTAQRVLLAARSPVLCVP